MDERFATASTRPDRSPSNQTFNIAFQVQTGGSVIFRQYAFYFLICGHSKGRGEPNQTEILRKIVVMATRTNSSKTRGSAGESNG